MRIEKNRKLSKTEFDFFIANLIYFIILWIRILAGNFFIPEVNSNLSKIKDKQMSEKVEYWLDIADYDLETARAMLKTKRYLYVGFMCHQVIEKGLKGIYAFRKHEIPPYIHNLIRLAKKSELFEFLSDEQKKFINFLEPLYIEARYPAYKDKIFQSLNHATCEKMLKNTEDLYQWIKQQLLKG